MPAGFYSEGEDIMAQARTVSSSVFVTRRGFLLTGVGSLAAWTMAAGPARAASGEFRCIMLNLVGGPSHLDTWDPKPDAPADYRGPFRAIRTKIPGVFVTELFPRLAGILDRVALIRSVYHDEAPIHESGLQLLHTGRLVQGEVGEAHLGERLCAGRPALLVPGPVGNTGVRISHGQERLTSMPLDPMTGETPGTLQEYGGHDFGRACLLARRLVERGTTCVTVNMFDSVYDSLSWDCHRDGGSLNVGLDDYRDRLAPRFDQAYTALILDLERRGLLKTTLVVAAGEFGRSPKINLRGGRDHWTGAWTVLFAGGGVGGGQVVGRTDRRGCAPVDRPVHASAIANTVLDAAGLPWTAHYPHGAPVVEVLGRSGAGVGRPSSS